MSSEKSVEEVQKAVIQELEKGLETAQEDLNKKEELLKLKDEEILTLKAQMKNTKNSVPVKKLKITESNGTTRIDY